MSPTKLIELRFHLLLHIVCMKNLRFTLTHTHLIYHSIHAADTRGLPQQLSPALRTGISTTRLIVILYLQFKWCVGITKNNLFFCAMLCISSDDHQRLQQCWWAAASEPTPPPHEIIFLVKYGAMAVNLVKMGQNPRPNQLVDRAMAVESR